ncbi:hypothetical protein TRICHSKD4_0108 [Roseibium sp. TrichSKD4]|nr:hypothetical protein TRICHSKD4_0108 [Roseibium sp. TrichSKD4]
MPLSGEIRKVTYLFTFDGEKSFHPQLLLANLLPLQFPLL